MMRGNNAQPIFTSDDDRHYFCLLLQESVVKYDFQIIAFCLMGNHVHLAIKLGEIPISKIVQNISFRYTRYYNYNNNLVGHLFQGRFKSILVGGHGYLRELIRYIHLNPVRAGIVDDPLNYPWSSHHSYLMHVHYDWVSRNCGLQFFGESLSEALEWYQRFILVGIGGEEEIDFKKGIANGVVGDEIFIESIQEQGVFTLNQPAEINLDVLILVVSEWARISPTSLSQLGSSHKDAYIRGVATYLAQNTTGITLMDLGEYFCRAANSLGQASRRIELKVKKSEKFRAEIENLLKKLASESREMNLKLGS
jgi:REP element-mobilizing transposase RayT